MLNMRIRLSFLFLTALFLLLLESVQAQQIGNKFGIHLARPDIQELDKAEKLINSSGGQWGYVTVVMQEDERDFNLWQDFFDEARRRKIIPIVRVATSVEKDSWQRPEQEEAEEWAEFLDSLNWVVKKRYVILFNEPNHAAEWGGETDPRDYARVALSFAKALKSRSEDFFIMPAGLDLAAPHKPPLYYDAELFIREFLKEIGIDNFEKYFDGWASHSYPNPGFSASVYKTGRLSVQGYSWELALLKRLGVRKSLPVFITETGWSRGALDESVIKRYFLYAYKNIWLPDPRVIAITPFILTYKTPPFQKFSWEKPEGGFYSFYEAVASIKKESAEPEIIDKAELKAAVGRRLSSFSSYQFRVLLGNRGQRIWRQGEYELSLESADEQGLEELEYEFGNIGYLEPFEETTVPLFFKTSLPGRDYRLYIVLRRGEQEISRTSIWDLEVMPAPDLKFSLRLFPKIRKPDTEVEIQVFDDKDTLVFRKKSVKVRAGEGYINQVLNVQIDKRYRVVVLKDFYLPRQKFLTFRQEGNHISFKSLLPLDPDKDGNFDLADFKQALFQPSVLLNLLPF